MKIEPLTKAGFAPFGDVIEIEGAQHYPINQGFAERFNDLASVDAEAVNISIVVANPRPKPIAITLMERHPLGSQIFYPLQDRPWLVLVCGDPEGPHTASAPFRPRAARASIMPAIPGIIRFWCWRRKAAFWLWTGKVRGPIWRKSQIDEIRLDLP